jgi:transposase-like protein
LVLDDGKTIGAVARDLDLTPSPLRLWVADRTTKRSSAGAAEAGLLRSIEAALELRRADLTERGVSAPLAMSSTATCR